MHKKGKCLDGPYFKVIGDSSCDEEYDSEFEGEGEGEVGVDDGLK